MSRAAGPEQREPLAGASLRALRDVRPRDLVIRFVFGAAISTAAGIVGVLSRPSVGGLFLAFPAILPATLTLIEKEESRRAAEDDDVGAILGAASLILFAVLAWLLLPRIAGAGALVAASVAWLVCAVSLYLCLRLPFRGRDDVP